MRNSFLKIKSRAAKKNSGPPSTIHLPSNGLTEEELITELRYHLKVVLGPETSAVNTFLKVLPKKAA